MPHYLLTPVGSAGDVHPFIGIAIKLKQHGHRVTIATNDYFKEACEKSGIDFIATGEKQNFINSLKDPDIWKPSIKSLKKIAELAGETIDPIYQIIKDNLADDLVVISSGLAFGARIAQDKLNIKNITIHLAPVAFFSNTNPAKLPGIYLPKWLPTPIKKTFWYIAGKITDKVLCPPINKHRKTLNLSPAKNILNTWWHSPTNIICAFPQWYANPQPDWPKQITIAGFPLYDEANFQDLSDDLKQFLKQNPKPIAFTPGSANIHGDIFFSTAVEASEKINHPAILLTKFPENQIPKKLPNNIIHVPYAPFSKLLPHCAALVHHGGIGTLSQALQAGIPQVITHMAHDQPDNAHRITQFNLGTQIKYTKITTPKLVIALQQVLENPKILKACKEKSKLIKQNNGIEKICQQITNAN